MVTDHLSTASSFPDVVVRIHLIEERTPHFAGFGGAFGVVDLGVGSLNAVERDAGIGRRDDAAIGDPAATARKRRHQAEQQHRQWLWPGA